LGGCWASTEIPRKTFPYAKLKLQITEDEAAKLMGDKGTLLAEERVPINPNPRIAFPRLPKSTQWRIWCDGSPTVILGMVDGRVVFINTQHKDDRTATFRTEVSPEFQ
jgi:hypothetical protein